MRFPRTFRGRTAATLLGLAVLAGVATLVVPAANAKPATSPPVKLAAATCSTVGTSAPVSLLPLISSTRTVVSQDNQLYNTAGAWTTIDCGTLSFTVPALVGQLQNLLLEVEVDAEGFCTGPVGALCETRVLVDGVEMSPAASSPADNTSWFNATSGGPDDANSRGYSRSSVVRCTNPIVGCTLQVTVQVKTPSGTFLSVDSTNVRGKLTNGIDLLQGFVPIPV